MDINDLIKKAGQKNFIPAVIVFANVDGDNIASSHGRDNGDRLLSTKIVKEKLPISDSTLYRWRKAGLLSFVFTGGKYRYRESDVNAILEGRR